jgi:hypothetical protein
MITPIFMGTIEKVELNQVQPGDIVLEMGIVNDTIKPIYQGVIVEIVDPYGLWIIEDHEGIAEEYTPVPLSIVRRTVMYAE